MHEPVMQWLRERFARLDGELRVFEVGAKAINGTARQAPAPGQVAQWWGCDLAPGAGVDCVIDGREAVPPFVADVAVCCEVFEHTPHWGDLWRNMYRQIRPGGVMLMTMACDPRAEHSAVDGGPLRPGEWYRNLAMFELIDYIRAFNVNPESLRHDERAGDIYLAVRRKPVPVTDGFGTRWLPCTMQCDLQRRPDGAVTCRCRRAAVA